MEQHNLMSSTPSEGENWTDLKMAWKPCSVLSSWHGSYLAYQTLYFMWTIDQGKGSYLALRPTRCLMFGFVPLHGSNVPKWICTHLPCHLHQALPTSLIKLFIKTSLLFGLCGCLNRVMYLVSPCGSILWTQTICVASVVWKISLTAWPPSSWSLLSKMLSPDAGQDVDRWQLP